MIDDKAADPVPITNQLDGIGSVQMDQESRLEAMIREMTRPINGQYPRPWMTRSTAPASSLVFTVGQNQAKGFPVEVVGSHEYYVESLFNRGAENCRQLYDRITGNKPSPTRQNTDDLVRRLAEHRVADVLETNVVCYSTPMSADLRQNLHIEGAERGRDIFKGLLDIIRPKVLIAHGSGTVKELSRVLKHHLPSEPNEPNQLVETKVGTIIVFVIPSLAPPRYNKWARWAPKHLDQVSRRVAKHLAH